MDDLKSVTVSYLRELARKHLGPGHSKLTKKELIAALAHFVPALKKLAKFAGIDLTAREKPAPKGVLTASRTFRGAQAMDKKPASKKASQKKTAEPAKAPPRAKASAQAKAPEPKKTPEKKAAEQKAPARKASEQKAAPAKKAAEARAPAKKAAEQKTPEAKATEKKGPEKRAAPASGRKGASPRATAAHREDTAPLPRPAQVVNFPPRSRSTPHAQGTAQEEHAEGAGPQHDPFHGYPAEPLLEGFFVARMVGESELRRHHLTEDQAPRAVVSPATGTEENLGELPVDYGNDLVMALARDPHTLFVAWDFSPSARARAVEGLDSPRAVLRVYEGDKLVRVEEFAIESRSFYIHGLPPGRPYRVEAHLVGRDGRSRRIGYSSHPVTLPQTGLSQDTLVRFMRMPPPPPPTVSPPPQPEVMAPELVAPPAEAEAAGEEREYFTWRRVPLPGSADMADVLESRRERLARQAPAGAPELTLGAVPEHLVFPMHPLGSSEQSLAMGERTPGGAPELLGRGGVRGGASELLVRGGGQAGASELLGRGGPRGGSSELSLGERAPGGASEQIHWKPPPSGRGR